MVGVKVYVDLKGFSLVEPRVKKAIQIGLGKIGRMIERDARIFAPRDTGRLKASISSTRKGFKVTVGSSVFYAEYMERPGNVLREGRRPWLKPALQKNISMIAPTIIKEVRGALR